MLRDGCAREREVRKREGVRVYLKSVTRGEKR